MFSTFSSSVTDLYGQTVVSDGIKITLRIRMVLVLLIFIWTALLMAPLLLIRAALGSGTTRFGVFGANNEDVSFNTMDNGTGFFFRID